MAGADFKDPQQLEKAAAEFARMAVAHAEKFYATKLDYTETSMEDVRLILQRLSEAVPRGFFAKLTKRGPSEEDMLKVATAYGAYVGELLRMHHGGSWKMLELPEGSTMAVHWGDEDKQVAMPLAVAQSILKGEKRHDMLLYYKAFAERRG